MKNWFAVIVTVLTATCALAADTAAPAVIPQPQKMILGKGGFTLKPAGGICTDDASRAAGEYLAAHLRRSTGYKVQVTTVTTKSAAKGDVLITAAGAKSTLGAEGYELAVTPESVVIRASAPAGAFYGVQTLLQLLPPDVFAAAPVKEKQWTVPSLQIEDSPRFPWRGLMLDVSRHFQTVDEVKNFLDLMALHKFNTMHFHLTDDQGWRIEIKKYPELTQHGSVRKESPKPGNRNAGDGTSYGPFFYTQAQIRDLVAYAAARHITIVPEIEMPGHVLGVLSAHPELSCRGVPLEVRSRWGVEADVLCVGNPKSLEFMKDVLTETMALFPSTFIHIGGDESPRERWQKCPKCQALLKAEGLAREAQLQTWFNRHIEKFLADHGRRLIGWDEILEGGLTPGAAVMSWRGMSGGTESAEQGHDVVMSPNSHVYLDHAQSRGPNEPETIGGYTPLPKVYSFEPVPPKLPEENRKHILGVQGNLWSEYLWTAKNVEYNAFPRACALSEVAWTPVALRNFDLFQARLETHLQRLDRLNVNYRRLDPPPVGAWQPAQLSTQGAPLDWDVSGATKAAGKYQATFNFVQGTHGIDIAWVALIEDGTEISRDAHAGFAGGKPRAATYAVTLPALKPGARYTLRAQVAGSGGTDSRGAVAWELVVKK